MAFPPLMYGYYWKGLAFHKALYKRKHTNTCNKIYPPRFFCGSKMRRDSDLPSSLYTLRSIVRDLTPEPLADLNSDSGAYPAAITADLGASVYLTVFVAVVYVCIGRITSSPDDSSSLKNKP